MENKSPLIKGKPAYATIEVEEDKLVVPKLDKEELKKLLEERKDKLDQEAKADIKKPQWPEQLTDIFKNLGKSSERGMQLPGSKKARIASTKHKKKVKKQQRGR